MYSLYIKYLYPAPKQPTQMQLTLVFRSFRIRIYNSRLISLFPDLQKLRRTLQNSRKCGEDNFPKIGRNFPTETDVFPKMNKIWKFSLRLNFNENQIRSKIVYHPEITPKLFIRIYSELTKELLHSVFTGINGV